MKTLITAIFHFIFLLAYSLPIFAQSDMHAAIEDLAHQLETSVTNEQKKKIGVLPFIDLNRRVCNFGIYLSESLTTQFFRIKKFEIVEKALMDKVRNELALHEKGDLDPTTVKRLGQIAGVDTLVAGTITDLRDHVEINCRLVDIETAKIIAVASVKIAKDQDVKELLEQPCAELEPMESASEKPSKEVDIKQTLYIGGDWLTAKLDSLEIVEGRFLRFNFTFVNPFETEARLYLDQPTQNTYIVDNLGNSYNFVSSLGISERGEIRLRPRERANISLLLDAHRKPARFVTLRTKWTANGKGFGGAKEFVVKNISMPGL